MTCDGNDYGLDARRMQFMDSEKVAEASKCGILDPTQVSKTNFTINLDKNSDVYKDMTMKEFNKVVKEKTQKRKMEVALYIARAISKFVKDGKTLINIPYHFK